MIATRENDELKYLAYIKDVSLSRLWDSCL